MKLYIPALFLLFILFSTHAYATENGKEYGNWKVQCADDAGTRCHIFQDLLEKESRQRVLHVAVGAQQKSKHLAIIITLPLGISLPPGIGMSINAESPIVIPLQVCFSNGCQAVLKLDQSMVESMRKHRQAEIFFYNLENKAIAIPLSLKGFSAALDAITN